MKCIRCGTEHSGNHRLCSKCIQEVNKKSNSGKMIFSPNNSDIKPHSNAALIIFLTVIVIAVIAVILAVVFSR